MFIVIWLSVFWIQNCQSISTDELLSVVDELDITNPYVYMKKELGSVHAFTNNFSDQNYFSDLPVHFMISR